MTKTERRAKVAVALAGGDPALGRRALPCLHEGAVLEFCTSCNDEGRHVRDCDMHDRCTRDFVSHEVRSCQLCSDYRRYPEPTTRHLLYHVYPRIGSYWRERLLRLRERIDLFNGRRVVAVATDRTTDGVNLVADALQGCGCEIFEVANDPNLREVATFLPLFERVAGFTGEGDVTLYAHAKGVTRPPGATCHRWAEVLEDLMMGHWSEVEKVLARFPLAGCFKKLGRAWPDHESRAGWHYSGSFYWFRNAELFQKPDWRRIDQTWTGIEPYPALHFSASDSGCMFMPGYVSEMNLYNSDYWHNRVEPAYAKFKAEQPLPSLADACKSVAVRWDGAGIARHTSPEEMTHISEAINSVKSAGVVVECGASTGFSSTCLSIACARAGRRLVVADSFLGLPDFGPHPEYTPGQFKCSRTEWEQNVNRFGRLNAVTVREGWFDQSLKNWTEPIAVLWIDVDLGLSVRDVLDHLLPYVVPDGRIFCHETGPEYFTDKGAINGNANEVWRAIRQSTGRRLARASYLLGCLGEVSLRPDTRLLPPDAWAHVFGPLSGKRVGFVQTPGNAGDRMIEAATLQLLQHFRVRWTLGPDPTADVILIAGGGSMGSEHYKECREARRRALDAGPPVWVLPQSWWQPDPEHERFAKLFARDRESLTHAPGAQLAPDLALGLAVGGLPPVTREYGLWLRREHEALFATHEPNEGDPAAACHENGLSYLELAAAHAEITTDRLHFAIAGLIAGRKVTLLPNSYHKNRSLWETSLRDLGCLWRDEP